MKELPSEELWKLFEAEYLAPRLPLLYRSHQLTTSGDGTDRERITLQLLDDGSPILLHESGTGPIDAAVRALGLSIDVIGYDEHSCGSGSDSAAIAYVEISTPTGPSLFCVGKHSNIVSASLLALISGVNRALRSGALTRTHSATVGGRTR